MLDLLNFYPVKAGEHYFIASGTVHAIGKGCVIAEIQQNSNLTYRVYDYGRKDASGKGRELHIDKAKKVTNFEKFVNAPLSEPRGEGVCIGRCEYFTVTQYDVNGQLRLSADEKSFKAVTFVGGEGKIGGKAARKGDTFFVPANHGAFVVEGRAKILVTEV